MCKGPLFRQTVLFTLPLIFSGVLQLLFHAADLIVVGRFASHQALAAVGVTAPLVHLIIGAFMGLAIGANVLVARFIGEKNRRDASRVVHTSIALSIICGFFCGLLAIVFTPAILAALKVPDEILAKSILYLRLFFIGMPFMMLYNFGSAILRAAGDTKRPFYFLVFAGIVNVLLNLLFVLLFHWEVAGVAVATVISHIISALLVLKVLLDSRDYCRVKMRNLQIHFPSLRQILWVGVPAGIQSACFSISNLLVYSSLNTFGAKAIAGNTAASNIEGVGFLVIGGFAQAIISFVGQNLGGTQYQRVRLSIRYCMANSFIALCVLGMIMLIFAEPLLSIFNKDPEVISQGILRLKILVPLMPLVSLHEIAVGALRGMGHSVGATVIMIFSICVFRIIWLWTAFDAWPTMTVLLLCYPITWTIAFVLNGAYLWRSLKKIPLS